MSNKHKIIIVDKYDKYSYLFGGLRKHKFIIDNQVSLSKFSDVELYDSNLFFMVLYEPRDIFELLKICKSVTPIIIASENVKILKKLNDLGCFTILDLSRKRNFSIEFHECILKVLS